MIRTSRVRVGRELHSRKLQLSADNSATRFLEEGLSIKVPSCWSNTQSTSKLYILYSPHTTPIIARRDQRNVTSTIRAQRWLRRSRSTTIQSLRNSSIRLHSFVCDRWCDPSGTHVSLPSMVPNPNDHWYCQ